MKRKLLYVAAGLLIIIILGFIFRRFIIWQVFTIVLKPAEGFDEIAQPPAPDYSRPENWAALPDRKDNADVLPKADISDNQADAKVDVFFLHPTTYYSRKAWNQPLDHEKANKITDEDVLRSQASTFNGSGRIYAPRYRQATLYSFMDEEGDGEKALDIAYRDVKSAFEYYLDHYNDGRPIVLASHSQGSRHGIKLLDDYFTGKPLQKQLVAAYLIGWGRESASRYDRFEDIPVCDSPEQTGCWMTWNTMGPKADRRYISKSAVCVNPLNWTIDGKPADRNLNLGGMSFGKEEGILPAPDVGIVDAQCVDGVLLITPPEADGYSYMPMGRDNYHIYDYALFYMNIRKNVRDRVEVYLNEPADKVVE